MIPLRDDISSHRPPRLTAAIILVCVLVFLWQSTLGPEGLESTIYSFGMIPVVLLGDARLEPALALVPPWVTLLTSMFLHGGWLHLAGNMVYLWIFANNIEDRLGHAGFLVFYLTAGIAAAAAQILPDPGSEIPMVGASGAISGVLGAYIVLYPHARVLVLIPISFMFLHYVKAGWLLGIWLAIQIVSGLTASDSGVAWWAHVGGFAAGALLILPFALVDRWRERRRWRGRLPGTRRPGPWG